MLHKLDKTGRSTDPRGENIIKNTTKQNLAYVQMNTNGHKMRLYAYSQQCVQEKRLHRRVQLCEESSHGEVLFRLVIKAMLLRHVVSQSSMVITMDCPSNIGKR